MKKITGLIVALLLVASVGSVAFAYGDTASGRATATSINLWYYDGNNYHATLAYLTNITDTEVSCTVNFYSSDGEAYNSVLKVYKGNKTGSSVILTDESNSFKIPAHSTRCVEFKDLSKKNNTFGYAVIEWSSADTMVNKALIGSLRKYGRAGAGTLFGTCSEINGGQPF